MTKKKGWYEWWYERYEWVADNAVEVLMVIAIVGILLAIVWAK